MTTIADLLRYRLILLQLKPLAALKEKPSTRQT